jgi:2-(1,2-epoxy-1,2-dihydrophenyl)acetyl-CoA isomerase
MGYEEILTEIEDGVLTLTLNRPEKLNAWTYQMASELGEAIGQGNDDEEVDAFVVTGAGRGFCAGADVKALFKTQADKGEVDRRGDDLLPWVDLLRASKPIVAAINGACIGVGLSQLMPMDVLVASRNAKLSFRFIKMGLIPELGSSRFLLARTGFGHASKLMLSGETIDAEEAERIGLVDLVTEPEELLDVARRTARSMGENPPAAVRAVKRLLTENMSESDLALVQRREVKALNESYKTPEHLEAIDAFLEKREPDFKRARRNRS